MSSGFVAAGTTDDPVKSNDEWEKAKQELDENKRRREEAAREEGGKSLYDVLQANKGKLFKQISLLQPLESIGSKACVSSTLG